ncbi:MAG: metal ABC transporter permease [Zetaproteobacteria bacterium]|nr:MAG: metal ABC transporter permease [Zetaproteobacteria bacterium]
MLALVSDFLASPVMMHSLPYALVIAVVTSSVSIMVLAHRLSFLTVGVSHASLAGLGIAALLGLPLLPGATVIATLIAMLLALMPHKQGISEDAGTGILFAGSMALGITLLSTAPASAVSLFGLLFGNILTISATESIWLWFLALLILLATFAASRAWWSIAFDPVTAAAGGLPVDGLRLLLYAVIALTAMLCVKLSGIVLTAGLMILPASCAWLWGRSLIHLWLLSLIFAVVGVLSGLLASYALDWPAGPTIVLALCTLFLASAGAAWTRKRWPSQPHP